MTYITEGETIFFTEYEESDFESYVAGYNKFYKGGYPRTEYFEKTSLHKKLETGNLLLPLGKLQDGTVVSVSAAERLTGALDGIVELFMRCVAPAYQGRHVGTAHEQYLLERIQERFPNAPSLQADAVTYDLKSQNTLVRNGFVACGFCLMMYDSATVLSALSVESGARMSFAIYCKPQCFSPVTVYPPTEHTAQILKIYQRLNVPVRLATSARQPSSITEYTFVRNDAHKTAELYISIPGNDAATAMFDTVRELLANGYTVVGHLNLSHPGCDAMYRRLRELGFYFSGVRPLSNNGQYLVMAQTENSLFGLETVFLPESEQSLLNYIQIGGK